VPILVLLKMTLNWATIHITEQQSKQKYELLLNLCDYTLMAKTEILIPMLSYISHSIIINNHNNFISI